MATKQKILEAIKRMQNARLKGSPKPEELPGMVEVWSGELDICLPEYLEQAVGLVIRQSKFFPTASELLQAHETAMLQAIEAVVGKGNANRLLETTNETRI